MDALIERAMAGDREAFAKLASTVIDRMYALAIRILRDRPLAEDAVQGALLRTWRDLPTLRDRGRFDAWLRSIVVNACMTEARRHRSLARVPNGVVDPIEPSGADTARDAADRDQLERALARLPVDQRAVVALHFYLGLSLVEVADALRIAPGTARSRLHYALRTLRAEIEADDRAGLPARRTA